MGYLCAKPCCSWAIWTAGAISCAVHVSARAQILSGSDGEDYRAVPGGGTADAVRGSWRIAVTQMGTAGLLSRTAPAQPDRSVPNWPIFQLRMGYTLLSAPPPRL